MKNIQNFKVKGRDGEEHAYVNTPLACDDSIAIGLNLAPLIGGPIGNAIEGVATTLIPKIKEAQQGGAQTLLDIELGDVIDVSSVLERMEWSEIGKSFGDGVAALSPKVLRQLLKTTSRDGAPLSNPKNFNSAYERNPVELALAAYNVLKLEGFLDFGSTSTNKAISEGETPAATPN